MVSTAQPGHTTPPAVHSLPLRACHQRLDGNSGPTALSASPAQLQATKDPITSREARSRFHPVTEEEFSTRQGSATKGAGDKLQSSSQQQELSGNAQARTTTGNLMPPVVQAPLEHRQQNLDNRVAEGGLSQRAGGVRAASTGPDLEHAGSLLSDLTNGPAALQRLAGALISSGGSSQEDGKNFQAWIAAVNAAVQQAQQSGDPQAHAFLARLTSTGSVQSSPRPEALERGQRAAEMHLPRQLKSSKQPQAIARDPSHPDMTPETGRIGDLSVRKREESSIKRPSTQASIYPRTSPKRQAKPETSLQASFLPQLESEPCTGTTALAKGSESKMRPQNFRVYSNTFQNRAGAGSSAPANSKQMVGRERAAPPAAEVRLKPIDPWLASSGSYNRSGEGHRVQTGSQIPATSGVSRALQVESNPFSSARAAASSFPQLPGHSPESMKPRDAVPVPLSTRTSAEIGSRPWSSGATAFTEMPQVMQEWPGPAASSQAMHSGGAVQSWMQLQALLHNIATHPGSSNALAAMIPKSSPFSSLEAWRHSFSQQSGEGMQIRSAPNLQKQTAQGLQPSIGGSRRPAVVSQPQASSRRFNEREGAPLHDSAGLLVRPLALAHLSEPPPGKETKHFPRPRLEERASHPALSPSSWSRPASLATPLHLAEAPRPAAEPAIPDPHNPFEVESYRMRLARPDVDPSTALHTAGPERRPSVLLSNQVSLPEHKLLQKKLPEQRLPKLGSMPPLSVFRKPSFTSEATARAATVSRSSDRSFQEDPDELAAETLLSLFEPGPARSEDAPPKSTQVVQSLRRPRSARMVVSPGDESAQRAQTSSSDEDAGGRSTPTGRRGTSRRRSSELKRKALRDDEDEAWVPRREARRSSFAYERQSHLHRSETRSKSGPESC